jgi:hypothetical protein
MYNMATVVLFVKGGGVTLKLTHYQHLLQNDSPVADIDFMGFKAKAYTRAYKQLVQYTICLHINGKLEYYLNQQITADNNLDGNE